MRPARKVKEIRGRSLFYRLLLSFIVFLSLPVVLFFIFINSGLLRFAEQTVDKANVSKLELVGTNIDMIYVGMRDTSFRITDDARIMSLFTLEYDGRTGRFADTQALYEAYQLAMDILRNKSEIQSVYLFDQSRDLVFSLAEGFYTRERFYDTQWIGPAATASGEAILGVREIPDNRGRKKKVITYVLPLKYLNVNGVMAVNVSLEAFNRNFVGASGDAQEGYAVMDAAGNLLYDVNDRLDNAQFNTGDVAREILASGGGAGSITARAGSRNYLVLYRNAPRSGLTVINTIPLDAQYDKLFYYRMLLYVIAGVTILLGAAVSYVMASRFYNPVKKVMEKLKNQVSIDPRVRNNELGIISDAINDLISGKLKDRQIIEDDRRRLRRSFVMNLVMGQATEGEEYDPLEGSACCVLISIDRYEAFSAAHTYREQYACKALILSVCEQVAALHAGGAGAILEQDRVALLVCSGGGPGDMSAAVRKVCDGIAAELSAVRDFTVSLGVGLAYEGREDLRRSFMEACAALKYRLVFGHRSTIFYSDVANRHGAYAFPAEMQNRLFNNLKLGAMQEITPLLMETAADMRSSLNRQASADSIMLVFNRLLARTMEYLDAEGIGPGGPFGERDLAYELTGKETLDEVCDWFSGVFRGIVSAQEARRRRPCGNDHVNRIVEMIRDNYMDGNLSIEFVADRLGLSYSHVRKIFKESIGMNFVDYLNRMRVANAKQLLLKTGLTIKEVAERSGYNNDQCLTRFFKRYEGVTPGRYRMNWAQSAGDEGRALRNSM